MADHEPVGDLGVGQPGGQQPQHSAFAAALFAATASIGSLRSRAIPRWLAIAGIPASVLMLANAVMPMAVITLWFVTASITLAVRPLRAATVPPPRSAPEQVAVVL